MSSIFLFLLPLAVGLSVGSFLNVLAVRLPAGERVTGRSRCHACGATIPWYHNVPILSFLLLGGRCARCRRPISWQYPAVELATAMLFVLVALKHFGGEGNSTSTVPLLHTSFSLLRDFFFVAVLVLVFVIDLRHYLILDVVTLPAAVLVAAGNLLLGRSWVDLAVGAILGAGFFLIQFWISRGRWIGDGDIRLGLLLGLSLGWPGVLVSLMFAYGVGALVGLGLVAAGVKRLGSKLPLGTFLSAGGVAALLWGEPMIRWYLAAVGY